MAIMSKQTPLLFNLLSILTKIKCDLQHPRYALCIWEGLIYLLCSVEENPKLKKALLVFGNLMKVGHHATCDRPQYVLFVIHKILYFRPQYVLTRVQGGRL